MRIPNFLGGVSQQPDDLRNPNQVQSAVNVSFSPTRGAAKRPPTVHVSTVATTVLDDYAVFPLDRDETYLALVGDGDIKVVTKSGTSVPVFDSTNSPSYAADFSYLDGSSRRTLRHQALVDTMFLVNTGVVVAGATGATQASWVDDGEAGVFVKQGGYAIEYTIKIKTSAMGSAETVSYTSHSARAYGVTSTTVVATAAQTVFNTGLLYNTLTDFSITSPSGGSGSVSLDDWQAGPGELELTYIGSTPWTVADTVKFDRLAEITYARGLQTPYIAAKLKALITDLAITGLTIEAGDDDSSFRITCTDAIEVFEVTDSVGNTYLSGWTGSVDDITDLPTVWKHGAIVRVSGSSSDTVDDYYVRFATDEWANNEDRDYSAFSSYSSFGSGRWEEYTYPVTGEGSFDATTMPHVLMLAQDDGAGTVTGVADSLYFDYHPYAEWNTREAGDSISNKVPSFVGKTIEDIFFWSGRLGFLSGSNFILSETGNTSNFWRTTVISLPESEVIDGASTDDGGANLVFAAPLDTRLYLFSTQSQIAVLGNPVLSPQSVEAPVVSKFLSSANVRPTLVGRSLFFGFDGIKHTGFREFLPGDSALQFGDLEITAHVPEYIPVGGGRLLGSTVDNSLYYHTDATPNRLWVYQYYRAGSDLLQASWSYWDFTGEIVDFCIVDQVVYLVTKHASRTYLEKIEMGSGQVDVGSGILVRVDRKTNETVATPGAYDVANDRTTFTLPYKMDSATNAAVVTRTATTEIPGGLLQIESITLGSTATTITVRGDHSSTPVWIGHTYNSSLTLNRPVYQVRAGQGTTPVRSGRTLIKSLDLVLDDTGYLEATVEYRGGGTYSTPFTGTSIGVLGAGLEADDFETDQPVRDATLTIPIHGKPQDIRVTLSNGTPLPSSIVSGEWVLLYTPRTPSS